MSGSADSEFLVLCEQLAAAEQVEIARDDLLRLLRLAGVEDTDTFRQVLADQRQVLAVNGAGIEELVQMARGTDQ